MRDALTVPMLEKSKKKKNGAKPPLNKWVNWMSLNQTYLNLAVLLCGKVTVWLPPHARAVVVATSCSYVYPL